MLQLDLPKTLRGVDRGLNGATAQGDISRICSNTGSARNQPMASSSKRFLDLFLYDFRITLTGPCSKYFVLS